MNAHGITTDFAMVESVVSIEIVTPNGDLVTATRENEHKEVTRRLSRIFLLRDPLVYVLSFL